MVSNIKNSPSALEIPDEQRCKRSDGKNWRCQRRRANSSIYCENHLKIMKDNYQKRRKSRVNINGSAGVTEDDMLVAGITNGCISDTYKIREPHVLDTIVVPRVDDLRGVLSVEAWRECISEADRNYLCGFLPQLEPCDLDSLVQSLFSDEDIYFGNPATKWGESVCKGDRHPDVLLHHQRELKEAQSKYFKHLDMYHTQFISYVRELEKLYHACKNDKDFCKQLKKQRKRKNQSSNQLMRKDGDIQSS